MKPSINKTTSRIDAFLWVPLIVLFIYLTNKYGLEVIRSNVENMGIWAPLGIYTLRFSSIVIPALPSTAYSILAGALLGFKKGLVIICIADLSSCILSFYISRLYGKEIVKRLIGGKFISRVENISNNHLENNFFLMTGLLMTGLFDFVCYAVGLTKTKFQKFLPALIISILLSNPPIVALGAGILEGGRRFLLLGVFGVFLIAVITGKLKKSSLEN